jgi:hypothetical protein
VIIPALDRQRGQRQDAMNLSFSFLAPGSSTPGTHPAASLRESSSENEDQVSDPMMKAQAGTNSNPLDADGRAQASLLAQQAWSSAVTTAGQAFCSIEAVGKTWLGKVLDSTQPRQPQTLEKVRDKAAAPPVLSLSLDANDGSCSPRSAVVLRAREDAVKSLLRKERPRTSSSTSTSSCRRTEGSAERSDAAASSSRMCSNTSVKQFAHRYCSVDPFQFVPSRVGEA